MKKLVTLLLAAGLVFSAASGASAVETRVSGTWDTAFNWGNNIYNAFQNYKNSGVHQKHFDAVQRMRFTVDFVMSENLSATYQVQVGQFTWGGAPADSLKLDDDNNLTGALSGQGGNKSENLGGRLGTRAANIVTRLAYLDWTVPNTSVKVRMGQQDITLPSFTFGSPVLDDNASGIVVSAPITDNIGLTALWARASSDWRRANANGKTSFHTDDTADLFGVIGDLNFDGITVQPWVTVGIIGKDSSLVDPDEYDPAYGNATAWWAGVSGELTMFDPFRFTADFIYNNVSTKHTPGGDKSEEVSAWYAALGAEYKTAYGTPALKGWYASGDSSDHANKDKRGGNLRELSGAFDATNTYFDGGFPLSMFFDNCSPAGTWGISAQWNGLSFVDNLNHSFSVTYVKGTNNTENESDPRKAYLTTKDAFVELDMTHQYNIYQNLAAILQVGYIIEDFDTALPGREGIKYDNAWRATVAFRYSF